MHPEYVSCPPEATAKVDNVPEAAGEATYTELPSGLTATEVASPSGEPGAFTHAPPEPSLLMHPS